MKHFIFGTLSGVIVGGIYGLINTPRSGKDNQKALKNYADETTDYIQDISDNINDLQQSISQLKNEVSFVQNDVMDEMNLIAKEFQHEAEPRLRRIQEKTEKMQTEVQNNR